MPLIYRTDLTEVFFHEGSSEYVLVTFGNLGVRANGSDYFGRTLVEKNDITCIGFAPRYPHWYPRRDIAACIPAIAGILHRRRVVTYGDSMGGYGALKHADLVGAGIVIAGSPQYSIDPADVPHDGRYRRHYNEELHLHDMRIHRMDTGVGSQGVRRYVLFDPIDKDDLYNLSLIAAAVEIRPFPLRYTSHYSFRVIASSTIFKQFVALALESRDIEIRDLLRASRKRSGTYHLYLARQCSLRGQPRAALSLLTSAEQLGVPAEDLYARLAEHYGRYGELAKAIEAARRALDLVPNAAYGYWLLGSLLQKEGRLPEARKMLRRAVDLTPDVAQYHFDLWSVLQMSGSAEAAIEAGLEAEPKFSSNAHFLRRLAILFRDRGDLIEAEARLRRAIALDHRPTDFHLELCDVLQRQGRSDDAIATAEHAVTLHPADPHLRSRLASLLKTRGSSDQAEQQLSLDEEERRLRHAIALNHPPAQLYLELCDLLQRQGRSDDAIVAVEQGAILYPADPHLRFRLGNLLNAAGRPDEAAGCFRAVAEKHPEFPGAWERLAECLGSRVDTIEEGLAVLRRLTQPGSQNYRAMVLMGHLLSRTGDVAGSKPYFRAALDMMPGSEDAMFSLANTLAHLNEADQISPLYVRFKEVGGTSTRLHNRVGEIMLAIGDLAAAEAAFQTALAANPADMAASAGLAKVRAPTAEAKSAPDEEVRVVGQVVSTLPRVAGEQMLLMDGASYARVQALWAAHGDAEAWNFFVSDLHHGDLYRVLTLLRPFRRMVAGGRAIRLITSRKPHVDLASMFSDVIDEVVQTPMANFNGREIRNWRIATAKSELTHGILINLYPVDYFPAPLNWGNLWHMLNEHGIFFVQLFKFLLGLTPNVAPDAPRITELARDAARVLARGHSIVQDNTLVLFPYAQSMPFAQSLPEVRQHFAVLAARSAAHGMHVVTSVVGTEPPIEGAPPISIPFDVLQPFAEFAGYAVTMRSGVTDVLSAARCKKVHIYPSQWWADYGSCIQDGLGGAETSLAFDLLGHPDPSRFADIVMSALLASGPGDGSHYVPRRIRDLLAVPFRTDPSTGRWRNQDFLIRRDDDRVFTSGVIAEGWGGLEDWGIWTFGYRSVLYVRAASTMLAHPALAAGSSVDICLDLCFAISPDTHQVLEYEVEINDNKPVCYEARWPDRWRLLRFRLPTSELNAAARVIFRIRNPVSVRVLSSGATTDDRVIGIGIARAWYETVVVEDAPASGEAAGQSVP
jgi:tetratricopeptide (TPR) repeat protein